MVAVAVPRWPADRDRLDRPRLRPVPSIRRRRVFWFRRLLAVGSLVMIAVAVWPAANVTLGWIGGGPLTAAGQPGGIGRDAPRVWIVRPGDTLWDIAVATGDHGDLRPLVDRLSAQVGDRPLQPGQRLTLPGT